MTEVPVDHDRWNRVSALVDELSDLAPEERRRRLDDVDEETRREIEALLESGEGRFLVTGARVRFDGLLTGEAGAASPFVEDSAPGTRVGPWRILREIGRGGMGTVFLAERADGSFDHRVALKVIKKGMDSDQVLARFLAERQILARLDYPNIARIVDGGLTGDGRPYFAMEYVDGERLTDHCDRRRLGVEARLRLFLTICGAVHHAHQNLIVHRDLKPGNVLMTHEGVPKLVDFGIAKALDPEGAPVTRTGLGPMTPDYASPEQLAGEAVTTAADTYSLGVMLHELLCGERPARKKSPPSGASTRISAASTAVADRRGTSPDRLRRELAGDLDNIVLMAMREEPARRYVSVAQLAEDVQRHLDRRPVLARRDTLRYRVGTFVRRNRLGVGAAALATTVLLATTALALWQSAQARRERLRADRKTSEARAFAMSLVKDLDADTDRGLTSLAQLSAKRTLDYMDTLAADVDGDPGLRQDLAGAYLALGNRLAYPAGPNSGDPVAGMDSYRKAIGLLESGLRQRPDDAQGRDHLMRAYSAASLASLSADVGQSLAWRVKVHEFTIRTVSEDRSRERRHGLEVSHQLLGEIHGHPYYSNVGDTASATVELQTAANILEGLCVAAVEPSDFICSFRQPIVDASLAGVFWAAGDLQLAITRQGRATARLQDWWRAHPESRLARDELALQHVRLANFLAEKGDSGEALVHLQGAIASLERMVDGDPNDAALARDLVRAYNLRGSIHLARNPNQALEAYRKAIDLGAPFSSHPEARERLADSHQGAANALAVLGQKDEALTQSRKAIEIGESLTGLDRRNAHYAFSLAVNYGHAAGVAERAGDRVAARDLYRKAIAILEPMTVADPVNVLKRRALRNAEQRLRALERNAGDRTTRP